MRFFSTGAIYYLFQREIYYLLAFGGVFSINQLLILKSTDDSTQYSIYFELRSNLLSPLSWCLSTLSCIDATVDNAVGLKTPQSYTALRHT